METISRINRILPTSEILKHSECVSMEAFFEDLIEELFNGNVEILDDVKLNTTLIEDIYKESNIGFAIEMISELFPNDGFLVKIETPVPMKVDYDADTEEYIWDESYCVHSIVFVYVNSLDNIENKINEVEERKTKVFIEKRIKDSKQ